MFSQPLAGVSAGARNTTLDPALSQHLLISARAVTLIRMQLFGAATWPPDLSSAGAIASSRASIRPVSCTLPALVDGGAHQPAEDAEAANVGWAGSEVLRARVLAA